MASGGEKRPAGLKDTVPEAMYRKENTQSQCLLLFFGDSLDGDIVFRGCISSAHVDIWAPNLRNLFSKLLILQNNQAPPWKPEPPAEQPRYCSLAEESWRGLLHLSIFPSLFFFFTHHLFVIAKQWQRTVLGPAGCLVSKAWPKISSSQ